MTDGSSAGTLALLPNAGLANKLLVWGRAQVFAHLNGLPVSTVGWTYPKIGPLLRGERSSRSYGRYFEASSPTALLALGIARLRGAVRIEPPCRVLLPGDRNGLFVFSRVPHWSDMFADLRDHRAYLLERLRATIQPEAIRSIANLPPPVVALHVRRGDFRALRTGEDFAKVGGVRTPNTYFTDAIHALRRVAGRPLPVTVFSDGSDNELSFLLSLPHVARSQAPNDVADLLLLSKARVIVASAGSTFGDWAAFMSEAVMLRHPDHVHVPVRSNEDDNPRYDGAVPASDGEWKRLWDSSIAVALAN